MNDSDQHSHIGLLFQMEMMFQSCPFQCLITREAQKEGSNTSVCYKAVLLNKKKVSGDQFIGLLFEAFHVGQGIVFPVELPSLNYLVVEQEKYIQKENDKISLEDQEGKVSKLISDARLTKVHIGLGGVGRTDSLGTLDFWIKSKKIAFMVRIDPPICLSGIPLAENVFQETDGISGICLMWMQGKGNDGSSYGAKFTLTIGSWEQEFCFGCLNNKPGWMISSDNPAAAEEHAVRSLLSDENSKADNQAQERKEDSGGEQKVEKKKGPFSIRQISVEFKMPQSKEEELKVFLKFTVLLSFSMLDVRLTGLKLGLPLKNLKDFKPSVLKRLEFDMEGLSVDFQNNGLVVSGGLSKTGSSYSGAVCVKYQSFELSALGSYEKMEDGTHSLFFWLLVRTPLGGPPAFYITGLAGGFGVNRRIKVPEIGKVKDFPLVAMARDKDSKRKNPRTSEVLELLNPYIMPEQGSYFIALGIEFTTFELLRTFALGIVTFGTELELHLLGVTTLSMPVGTGVPLVYAELFLKAAILPSKGTLTLEGQLSDKSYLFDKNCKLSGGFAMCVWFGANPHSGDFVVTIGGYHPMFQVPSHYPSVDRVGIRWEILSGLTLEGNAYFALTPVGIMAGGGLSILYQKGRLKAWFIASADFLMQWAPLHYDISLKVRVGVSYTFKIFGFRKTLGVELGASLHLYGPEFAGEVSISWFIISFTIKFGNRNSTAPKMSWREFKEKFLSSSQKFRVIAGMVAGEGDSREEKSGKAVQLDGKKLELEYQTKLPMTEVYLGEQRLETEEVTCTSLGILPMGENNRLYNKTQLTLLVLNNGEYVPCNGKLSGMLKAESLPPSMWGLKTPKMNETKLLSGSLTAVRLRIVPNDPDKNEIHYYEEKVLAENERLTSSISYRARCCLKQQENPGERMKKMLERRARESGGKEISELLCSYELKKNSMAAELGEIFEIWSGEELQDHSLYEKPGGVFLADPVIREFF